MRPPPQLQPGRGCRRRMRWHAASTASGGRPSRRASPATSLAASAGRWCSTTSRARARCSGQPMAGSCSVRHSCTLRAPTPAGSSDCTRRSAISSSSALGRRVEVGDADQLVERRAQVAVVVERVDDRLREQQVARRQRHQVQLRVQVGGERGLGGDGFQHAPAVAVVGGGARPGARASSPGPRRTRRRRRRRPRRAAPSRGAAGADRRRRKSVPAAASARCVAALGRRDRLRGRDCGRASR